jgi:hypothetical protein
MKLGDTGRIKLPLPRRSANGDWQVARQWKLDSVASCKSSVNHGVWTFVLNFVGGQTVRAAQVDRSSEGSIG